MKPFKKSYKEPTVTIISRIKPEYNMIKGEELKLPHKLNTLQGSKHSKNQSIDEEPKLPQKLNTFQGTKLL